MSLKDLWRPDWTAGSRQCQDCSRCPTRRRGQGSTSAMPRHWLRKFAAAHHRVHHGCILGHIVVLAEEVVIAGLCTSLLVFSSFKKQPNISIPTVWGERRGIIPQTFQWTRKWLRSEYNICNQAGIPTDEEIAWSQCFMVICSYVNKMTASEHDTESMNRHMEQMV